MIPPRRHRDVPRLIHAHHARVGASLIFLVWALFAGAAAMAIEEPDYVVLANVGDVEFRQYDPYIVAEVTIGGDSADNRAFRILAGYIFGDNTAGEKMAMTAPVETRGEEHAFVMERKYTMESLPEPTNPDVRLVQRPGRVMAVHRYSGGWSEERYEEHEQVLLDALAKDHVTTVGPPVFARYNAPFTPWFLRRNEIMIEIEWQASE